MESKRRIASETVYIVPSVSTESPGESERIRKSLTEFDNEGRQVRESSWDLNGNYEQIVISIYGEDGKLSKQEIYLDERHLSETHIFAYDDTGRLNTETVTYAEGGQEEIRYSYDEEGHLLRKQFLSEDGEEEALEVRRFEDGKLVSERREEYGELSIERILEYTDGRLVTDRTVEDLTDTVISYAYDDAGRVSEHRETVNGKPGPRYEYGYDEKGRLVSERSLVNGIWHSTELGYDEHGNEVTRTETMPDGRIVLKVRREHDENGTLLSSEVEADTMGIGLDRHYQYFYEYTYH